jgi:SMC interacting uncharacterized protein involved in chromosome segregation
MESKRLRENHTFGEEELKALKSRETELNSTVVKLVNTEEASEVRQEYSTFE